MHSGPELTSATPPAKMSQRRPCARDALWQLRATRKRCTMDLSIAEGMSHLGRRRAQRGRVPHVGRQHARDATPPAGHYPLPPRLSLELIRVGCGQHAQRQRRPVPWSLTRPLAGTNEVRRPCYEATNNALILRRRRLRIGVSVEDDTDGWLERASCEVEHAHG